MSKPGQDGQTPVVAKDVNLKLEAFFQINKDDVANIAVSRIENELNDFIDKRQKHLRELNESRNNATKTIDDLRERTVELATEAPRVKEVANYIEETLTKLHGKAALKTAVNVTFNRDFLSLYQESEIRQFLDTPKAEGLFFAHVEGNVNIPVGERNDYRSYANFTLALSSTVVPGVPAMLNQILDAAKDRDQIIQKITETTQLITDARGQLADIDRIIREARAAVSMSAMKRSEGGDEIMDVINQIPGFNRLQRLIGSPT